jgi:hypothetical protein
MPSSTVECPPAIGTGEEWATRRPRSTAVLVSPGKLGPPGAGGIMRFGRGKFETYPLTCMVCGALPATTCRDEDYQELPQVHPSRRMSIGERNWRFRQGWEQPELVERRRKRQAEEKAGLPCSTHGMARGEAGAEGPAESRPDRLVTGGPGLLSPGASRARPAAWLCSAHRGCVIHPLRGGRSGWAATDWEAPAWHAGVCVITGSASAGPKARSGF